MDNPVLKVDWATHAAAKFACEKWHYSSCTPVGPTVKVGAWEGNRYIGCVIFGHGANYHIGSPYNLGQNQCCELVRVALREHKAPVSQVVARAISFMRKANPGVRLIVSYADPEHGHHGGIYQAMGWVYRGKCAPAVKVFYNGRWAHKKTVDDAGVNQTNLLKRVCEGKHCYLFPLDADMRKQIMPLAKPYPKRAGSDTKDTPGSQPGEGSSTLTPALHLSCGLSNG